MTSIEVKCPYCGSTEVIKFGKNKKGKQRYYCKNERCQRKVFLLEYEYEGWKPEINERIVSMAENASGIRDTSRVLKISTYKVMAVLKKKSNEIVKINPKYTNEQEQVDVEIVPYHVLEGVELDEQWSYVQNKSNQRWLWLALNHTNHDIIAYTFGKRTDDVFLELKKSMAGIKVGQYYSDDWGAYTRNLTPEEHTIGKTYTQSIERQNLNFRTRVKRLARKTICFSKTELMHDTVIGIYINRTEFGLPLS
jgi:IS1 family transposase/transposase-like protein